MKKLVAAVVVVVVVVVGLLLWHGRGKPARTVATAPPAVGSTAAGSASAGGAPSTPSRGQLEGRVHDAQGKPIASAVVQVVDAGAPRAVGADGGYRIDALDVGPHAVVASAPGYLPMREDAAAVVDGQTTRLDFTLTAGGHSITGTVTDASGGPIEGATVTAQPKQVLDQGPIVAGALTDRDGHYRLTLASGGYVIAGERDDYLRAAVDLELGEIDRTVDLQLVPAGVVEGVVRDVATGAPVPGARVNALGDPGSFGVARRAGGVVTDADGRFRATGLTPGVMRLSAVVPADGRQSREPVQVSLGIGEQVTAVELWVEAAPYIAGRVIDQDGKPIEKAKVLALSGGGAEGTETDADGAFQIPAGEPGPYRLIASHPRYAAGPPRSVTLAEQPIRDVVITLTSSPRVVGTVVPPTVATIAVDPDQQSRTLDMMVIDPGAGFSSGPDGKFEVSPITPGTHTISAKAADGRRGTATVVVPAQGDVAVTIELADRASIAGAVHDQRGAPVVGAAVVIRRTSGAVVNRTIINGVEVSADHAVTGSDGSFIMRGLDEGTYALAVHDERGGALAMKPKAVSVKLGASEQKRGVALSVEIDDGLIRGVVTGPDGAPMVDAWVSAVAGPESMMPEPADGDGPDGAKAESTTRMMVISDTSAGGDPPVLTDGQGRFELRGLRRGSYDIVAEAERGALRGRTPHVATGTTTAVRLAGLGVLTGTVTDGRAPVTDVTIELDGPTSHRQRYRTTDGRFRIERLEPGTYHVRASGPSGSGSADATVGLGAPATVAITVIGNGTVRGRLVDSAGQPVANAPVLGVPGSIGEHGTFSIEGPPETSDGDGRFTLTLAPGPYTLFVLRPNTSPGTDAKFTIASGQTVELGDVTLPAASAPPAPKLGSVAH